MIGRTLAHYEVVEKIGAGGMGEVYRARDGKLGRDVALKILPEDFAGDAERLARFDREARLLASLNHSNIASIYGIEEAAGQRFLVLEMVDGEDLMQRLGRGPFALDQALTIGRQIAAALEAAHEHGIVHRDLKPSNVKIASNGDVKVLDFGLAKAVESEASDGDLSQSPTLMTSGATGHGVILGTAGYMSPEQARGRSVDARADIWAFGCLLFEMLTGEQAFRGETVSDTLAAVLRGDPDWSNLPPETPPTIRRLLRRCLEKDPTRRLHHVADARIEIDDALAGADDLAATGAGRRRPSPWVLTSAAVVVVVIGVAIGWMLKGPAPSNPKLVRRVGVQVSSLARRFGGTAVSPDGRFIVTRGGTFESRWTLFMRPLDSYEGRSVPGSEDGFNPFFSPDGQWIGFFDEGGLKRAAVSGGTAQKICDTFGAASGTWGSDGTIVFSHVSPAKKRSLYRVNTSGGSPELLAEPDIEAGERAYTYPDFLPDSKAVFFTIETAAEPNVAVLDLATGEKHLLATSASYPRYSSSGHLLYLSTVDFRLMAAPFDTGKLEITRTPIAATQESIQPGEYDISDEGTLVYFGVEDLLVKNTVILVDRDGKSTVLVDRPDTWAQPRMSPDGRRVLLRQVAPDCMLWSFDIARRTMTRLTFEGDSHDPRWLPDGKRVSFSYEKTSIRTVYEMPIDGSGEMTPLIEGSGPQGDGSWTKDGERFVYAERGVTTDWDLWVYSRSKGASEVFLQSEFSEAIPTFSPDGRWIAYVSNESGRDEIYVRPYPGPGGKTQISRDGGTSPLWSPVGGELLFISRDRVMTVAVTSEPEFTVGVPDVFYEGEADLAAVALAQQNFLLDRDGNFDVTPDGKQLVLIKQEGGGAASDELRVVVNWVEELGRLVPIGDR